MKVIRNIHNINAKAPHLANSNYLKNRIGFWGIVKDVNSLNNTVTVISDTGYEFTNIQVKSDEWVTLNDKKDYVPSTRNLPPKNSRVFVLTPTYTAVGAFVLCSGFSRGDENIRELWAKDESELEEKNNSRETKTQGGWNITEQYENGNYSAVSNDGKIAFSANTTQDDEKSQKKEVSLKAWNNTIVINENGISITDKNGNEIVSTDGGITLTDSNNNTFVSDENGIIVTDSKGNTVQSGISNNKELFKVEVVKKVSGAIVESSSILLNSNKATIKVGGDSGTTIEQTASSVSINGHLEVGL